MRKYFCLIVLILTAFLAKAQGGTIDDNINNLRYVTEVPYGQVEMAEPNDVNNAFEYNSGCGDRLFWKVVGYRLRAVPQLINMVEDMRPTQAKLPSGGGYYRTGDAALMALKEIIHNIPIEALSGLKTADFTALYYFYEAGLKDKKIRYELKEALAAWYKKNQKNIIFKVGQSYGNCECWGKHPVGGAYYFEVK